jgi:hypothetical protein
MKIPIGIYSYKYLAWTVLDDKGNFNYLSATSRNYSYKDPAGPINYDKDYLLIAPSNLVYWNDT